MKTIEIENRASNIYPFSGGIAGKLGDRFEAKWAVKKLFEVLLGHADSMQFEFVDPVNHGVEFWLSKNGHKEWYQAKRQNTQGNWTIGRLAKEGVLATALSKLSASHDDTFHFVSTAPATELHHLAQRAALIETDSNAFINSLTTEDRSSHLPELCRHWEANHEQAWQYLKRLQVHCEFEADLDINLKMFGGQFFRAPYSHFFPLLREYLENNFNRELTTETARHEIIDGGILAPRAPLDPTLREKIDQANQRYLESYAPFGIGGTTISRNEAREVLSALTDEDNLAIILLTGNAGTGKSGVIREILSTLKADGATFLAFRVDNRLAIDSPFALGQALYGFSENPVNTLQSLAPDGKAILFIDQIDAISEVSGRTGAIREVIFELLSYARFSKNIRIIAACRTYDLANDSALLQLEKDHKVRRIEINTLDWATEVEPLFSAKGIPCDSFSAKQRELLALPLNLALFLEVYESGEQTIQFQSTTELFDRLIEKKQRAIRGRGYSTFDIMQALSHLANVMSSDQSLDASETVLDNNALDLLATEHLVSRVNGRINFFHESLFDYSFARGFVTGRKNLIDFLRQDEQHLFRRTQVRQILAMYRQAVPALYIKQLRELLISSDVRYHLRDAVVRWLGGLIDTTETELNVVLALDTPAERMPPLVRMAIYAQSGLLPILIRRGLIAEWLGSPNEERRSDAHNILWNSARAFPAEVALVLRNWWNQDSGHGKALLGWFARLHDMPPAPELLQLNLDLIRSKPAGLFERAGLYDRHSMSAWLKHDPAAAGKLLQVWFETWYEIFQEGHPFGINQKSELDYHWLEELQKKSSAIFLEVAIPAFIEAIRRINLTYNGRYWTDHTWHLHFYGNNYGPNRFLGLIRKSLAELAKSEPNKAIHWFEQIELLPHPATQYLCLEMIASASDILGYKLPVIVFAEGLFDVGPNGAKWLSFARAANAALPHISQQERCEVESRILNHWPELQCAKKIIHELNNGRPEEEPFWTRKSAIRDLSWNGFDQWCVLKSIDTQRLSPQALRRLAHLDRKFHDKIIPKPSNMEVTCVPPPIGSERAKLMSDEAWLSAVGAYCDDRETSRARGDWHRHTGASGLSGILQSCTKENPERFARLLLRLPRETNQEYFNGVLNGLAESEAADDVLLTALRHAHALYEQPCCEGICRILQKRPTLANYDDIFAMLLWYVENGVAATTEESDHKRAQELYVSVEILTSNGTMTRGVYYDRGAAVETFGVVLWECDARLKEGVKALSRRIESEPLESIRCLLAEPIYSVLRQDNSLAASLLKQLVVREQGIDLLPLATYKGVLLLYYILHGSPGIGQELLELLLTSDDEDYRLLGTFHLCREAFYDESFTERARLLIANGDRYRQLAAYTASNHLSHAAYRLSAEQQLTKFFNDPVKEIRAEAAECFREIWNESIEAYRPLLQAFIQSKAFEEDNFSFFHLLKDAHETTTEEVLLAAEQILNLVEQPDDNLSLSGRRKEMHYLDDLLLKEYSATENSPELRKRILDILDRMLILGLYGTDKIIEEHERI